MSNQKLDRALLQNVLAGFGSTKQAFVPMPGGQTEPVAGASLATAALGSPMGGPQGAAPQGAAPQGNPQGGQPSSQGGGGGGMPPEIQEVLADPQVQQMLQQAGFTMDPASGNVLDPASGQPVPPDQLMQILQQLMGGQQGAPQGGAQPQDPGAQPQDPAGAQAASEPPPADPMTQIVQLLTEIKDHLANGAAGKGAAGKEKKASPEEMMQGMQQELQRLGEIVRSSTGQQ